MAEYFLVLCLLVFFAAGLWAIWYKLTEIMLFTIDPNNPYRRFCKICGQRQEEHGEYMDDPHGWWEVMDESIDPKCKCHFYAVVE